LLSLPSHRSETGRGFLSLKDLEGLSAAIGYDELPFGDISFTVAKTNSATGALTTDGATEYISFFSAKVKRQGQDRRSLVYLPVRQENIFRF